MSKNGEGFAFRAWRLGLRADFIITLFGEKCTEEAIRGWWSIPQLRRMAVSK